MKTKFLNPRDAAKTLLRGEDLPENFYSQHLNLQIQSDSNFNGLVRPVYGISAASIDAQGQEFPTSRSVEDCFDDSSKQLDENTIFNIASITKPITTATILRMVQSEEFKRYFTEGEEFKGLDIKLSHFYDILKDRYPNSNYVKNKLRNEEKEISLKDLITHTSGIKDFDGDGWRKAFSDSESGFNSLEKPADGKLLEIERPEGTYGEYSYSDVGYELLGMVILAIGTDAKRKSANSQDVVTCGEMMRRFVIEPLEMKNTFTPDQMGFDESGRVAVKEHPNQEIARGYVCDYKGNLSESSIFCQCISCSGIYSNPLDLCKFFKAFLSKNPGFFTEETIRLRDSHTVLIEDKKEKGSDNYGIGFILWRDGNKENPLYCHGGKTLGFSGWIGHRDGKTACCLVSCQNLTAYFAEALLDSEVSAGKIQNEEDKHLRFCQINEDLLKTYKKEQLLEALQKAKIDPTKNIKENYENLRTALSSIKPHTFPHNPEYQEQKKPHTMGE